VSLVLCLSASHFPGFSATLQLLPRRSTETNRRAREHSSTGLILYSTSAELSKLAGVGWTKEIERNVLDQWRVVEIFGS